MPLMYELGNVAADPSWHARSHVDISGTGVSSEACGRPEPPDSTTMTSARYWSNVEKRILLLEINLYRQGLSSIFTLTARGSTLDVRIWRLKSIPALQGLTLFVHKSDVELGQRYYDIWNLQKTRAMLSDSQKWMLHRVEQTLGKCTFFTSSY